MHDRGQAGGASPAEVYAALVHMHAYWEVEKVAREVHAGAGEKKKETKLGLSTKKSEDFGSWYSEVVVESEMISYYDVSGAAACLLAGGKRLPAPGPPRRQAGA